MSDGTPTDPAMRPDESDDFDAGIWTPSAADVDPMGGNIFTVEIENVSSSAWEIDPDVIWGDEIGAIPEIDGGALGTDFTG